MASGEYIRFQCSGFRIGIFPDTRNLTPDTRSLYSRGNLDILKLKEMDNEN
jgi:hypothetical protein